VEPNPPYNPERINNTYTPNRLRYQGDQSQLDENFADSSLDQHSYGNDQDRYSKSENNYSSARKSSTAPKFGGNSRSRSPFSKALNNQTNHEDYIPKFKEKKSKVQ